MGSEHLAGILGQAIAAHQHGDLRTAARLYRSALVADAHCFDALHLLGVVHAQEGDPSGALALLDQAIGVGPDQPVLWNNRGNVLRQLGRSVEALASYDRALALAPCYPDALTHRGNALQDLGRSEEALHSYEAALALLPEHPAALLNKGNLLCRLARPDEALECLSLALAVDPRNPEVLHQQGLAFAALERFLEAAESFATALALRGPDAALCSDHGEALLGARRFAEALASFDAGLACEPEHRTARRGRANALAGLRRYDEARTTFDQLLARWPDWAEALNDRGSLLLMQDQPDAALSDFHAALEARPGFTEAILNTGKALVDCHRHQEALDCYQALPPSNLEARFHEAFCRLLLGDYARGWPLYEARHALPERQRRRRDLTQRMWTGEECPPGTRILVHCEQGFGDSIQFFRCVPELLERGMEVVLEVPTALRPLLDTGRQGLTVCTPGQDMPPCDLHCPLMSLPLALRIDAGRISGRPYLMADPERVERWRARLGPPSGRLRVGVAWAGNPDQANDHHRSMPFHALSHLFSDDIDWICLQHAIPPRDLPLVAASPALRRIAPGPADFSDTAALMSLLDLVITVDSSPAHLAGALGVPVWVMLCFSPDWRWLLGREDCPWYASARLFRQAKPGDWASITSAISERLRAMA